MVKAVNMVEAERLSALIICVSVEKEFIIFRNILSMKLAGA